MGLSRGMNARHVPAPTSTNRCPSPILVMEHRPASCLEEETPVTHAEALPRPVTLLRGALLLQGTNTQNLAIEDRSYGSRHLAFDLAERGESRRRTRCSSRTIVRLHTTASARRGQDSGQACRPERIEPAVQPRPCFTRRSRVLQAGGMCRCMMIRQERGRGLWPVFSSSMG